LSEVDERYELGSVEISRDEIKRRVVDLAADIEREYRGQEVTLTGVLKGAAIFLSDLAREIGTTVDVRMDFMAVSSYGNSATSSGVVKIIKDMDTFVDGKNIIVVEDIMDTGLTLAYLREILRTRNPKSLKTCVLLEKPERKKVDSEIEYRGFTIADVFVVGYGLDYAGKWRHLPDIWSLSKTRQ
jgi:hypoxanthine phosphoribosyltransferase